MAEAKSKVLSRCFVSLLSTTVTQLSLFTITCFFNSAPLFILLSLSVVLLLGLAGVGRCCKRLLRVRASAPAFVFLNVVFSWGVYVGFIRNVITPRMDFLLNIEFLMLVIGLCRMLSTDPGYATNGSSHIPKLVENPASEAEDCDSNVYEFTAAGRVRFCTHCKVYVQEFDHHCPAFGNCIGQKNHVLFIMLLVGFLCTEASYIACSLHCAPYLTCIWPCEHTTTQNTCWCSRLYPLDSSNLQILGKNEHVPSVSNNFAISTMIFSLLQVPWQGLFLAWHIYCVCFNIKTDEWINWKNYPEFHIVVYSEPGKIDSENSIRFRNPYDKGIMQNLTEFLIKSNR